MHLRCVDSIIILDWLHLLSSIHSTGILGALALSRMLQCFRNIEIDTVNVCGEPSMCRLHRRVQGSTKHMHPTEMQRRWALMARASSQMHPRV